VEEQKQLIKRLQRQLREAMAAGSSVSGSAAHPSGAMPPAAAAAPLSTGNENSPFDSKRNGDGGTVVSMRAMADEGYVRS